MANKKIVLSLFYVKSRMKNCALTGEGGFAEKWAISK
jgi:hypothetical protein